MDERSQTPVIWARSRPGHLPITFEFRAGSQQLLSNGTGDWELLETPGPARWPEPGCHYSALVLSKNCLGHFKWTSVDLMMPSTPNQSLQTDGWTDDRPRVP